MTLLPVPIVRQESHYSCGAAALAACLIYWKVWFLSRERDLWAALGTCAATGTEAGPIVKVARTHGLVASYRRRWGVADLRKSLGKGETVIIAVQAWTDRAVADWSEVWDDGHWVVVVGLDDEKVYVMCPSIGEGYGYVDLSELAARWHDLDARSRKTHGIAVVLRGKERLDSFPAPPRRLG